MAENNFEGIEIPDELLDSIAGGKLNNQASALLRDTLIEFKSRGATLDQAVERIYFPKPDPVIDRGGIIKLAESIWRTL